MNLLVDKGNNKSKSTFYCHEEARAGVVRVDHSQLAKILEEDKENLLPKFLKKTAYQKLILHNKSFDQFISLTQQGVKQLVNMSDFKLYKEGEEVLMKSGGIVWKGKIKNQNVP